MKSIKKNIFDTLSTTGSTLFSSPVITTTLTILIITKITYPGLILSFIFFYVITPILAYSYLRKTGLITDKTFDFNIRKREERTPYNIILLLGFLTNYILINMYNIPVVTEIALLILISFLAYSLISTFWKISGHMTQTVLTITTLAYLFPNQSIYILLIGYLLFVPWVGWSRVYDKHHNIYQVIAGTLVTSLLAFIVFTIL
ncbi:phosphatase PAP2 family protein [bacterium]|nr:phosphatase PAP2 family protein [bacterium]